uniref:Uncharacterized protein n=1 Tax=Glossina brevipalpis TaxID=37001 RepID=A0A1A9W5R6_9MUSC
MRLQFVLEKELEERFMVFRVRTSSVSNNISSSSSSSTTKTKTITTRTVIIICILILFYLRALEQTIKKILYIKLESQMLQSSHFTYVALLNLSDTSLRYPEGGSVVGWFAEITLKDNSKEIITSRNLKILLMTCGGKLYKAMICICDVMNETQIIILPHFTGLAYNCFKYSNNPFNFNTYQRVY